jgi:hypothetical protein
MARELPGVTYHCAKSGVTYRCAKCGAVIGEKHHKQTGFEG